jgi:protein phosphatase
VKLDLPPTRPLPLGLRVAGASDIGLVRAANEDAWGTFEAPDGAAILALADGMGGLSRGDLASIYAIDGLLRAMERPTLRVYADLRRALVDVDEHLRAQAGRARERSGTTLVGLRLCQGRGLVTWVGDSSFYLLRSGRIIAQSWPHRLIDEIARAGLLQPRPEHQHLFGHVLSRCLGGPDQGPEGLQPSFLQLPALRAGDRLLLASDGLTDQLDERAMADLACSHPPGEAVVRLVEAALASGGSDNITVILGRVEPAGPGQLGRPWEPGQEPDHGPLPVDPPVLPAEIAGLVEVLRSLGPED